MNHHHPPTPQRRRNRRTSSSTPARTSKIPPGVMTLCPKEMVTPRPALLTISNKNPHTMTTEQWDTPTINGGDASIESSPDDFDKNLMRSHRNTSIHQKNVFSERKTSFSYGIPDESPAPSRVLYLEDPDESLDYLKATYRKNSKSMMMPSPSDQSLYLNDSTVTDAPRQGRLSYGVPDVSPVPSEILYNKDHTPGLDYLKPSYRRPLPSPSDESMYLDAESETSSNISSPEEHSDMYTFATIAASLLQKATEDASSEMTEILESPSKSSVCSSEFSTPSLQYKGSSLDDTPVISNDSTPVVKNTSGGKSDGCRSPHDQRAFDPVKTVIDWVKFNYPKPSNPSPMSLPSMLGAPVSVSNNVSELESPILFLESRSGFHNDDEDLEESTINSQSQTTLMDSSRAIGVCSSKNDMKEDPPTVNQCKTQKEPPAAKYQGSSSNNLLLPMVKTDQKGGDEDSFASLGNPTPNSRIFASEWAASKASRKMEREVPSDFHVHDLAIRERSCWLSSKCKYFALCLLVIAVLFPIVLGSFKDKESLTNSTAGDQAKPTVTDNYAENSFAPTGNLVPTPAPLTTTTSRPTLIVFPPYVSRPTSPISEPISRPSIGQVPTSIPKPTSTIAPIWSDVLSGESDLANANAAEVHWPHYFTKTGLRLELVNALDMQWQSPFEENIKAWRAFDSIFFKIYSEDPTPSACDPVWGHIKFCNRNLGETNWRAMTQVFLRSGNVVASTIQLNDFYPMSHNWAQVCLFVDYFFYAMLVLCSLRNQFLTKLCICV
jgi:hypothetical protein